ncbi:MAG TPA: glycosyltransferase family 1 protein [Anaerolineae bacterium]|nr:glycosyltransferase family 1 protein [Anaerolineae bacterium]
MTFRILYVDFAPFPGGSIISLAHLVEGLDPARWQPMVVLSAQNAFHGFDAMGVPVMRVRTPLWEAIAPPKDVREGRVEGRWRQRLAAFMREGNLRARFWRVGGDLRRWGRDVFPTARALRPIIATFQPHLIHLNNSISLVRPGLLAARWTRTPALVHHRSFIPPDAWDRRWLLSPLQGMIAISEAVARCQREAIPADIPMRVIPNAVDMATFQEPVDRDIFLREWNIPPEALVVGMVGRIVPWKGQHVFIEALARLRHQLPHVHGLILGEADSLPGQNYKATLLARAQALGLTDHLHWAGHREDISHILPALDALAHCSVTPEPFGRVVIEGMAAGVPVVASNAGGPAEIIEDGVNGLLTPPGDADALAAALHRVLTDAVLRTRLMEHGRESVAQRFTVEKHVQAVTAFYEAILAALKIDLVGRETGRPVDRVGE